MLIHDTQTNLSIDPHYAGLPGIALGGYSSGLLAAALGTPSATVKLRRPVPVAREITLEQHERRHRRPCSTARSCSRRRRRRKSWRSKSRPRPPSPRRPGHRSTSSGSTATPTRTASPVAPTGRRRRPPCPSRPARRTAAARRAVDPLGDDRGRGRPGADLGCVRLRPALGADRARARHARRARRHGVADGNPPAPGGGRRAPRRNRLADRSRGQLVACGCGAVRPVRRALCGRRPDRGDRQVGRAAHARGGPLLALESRRRLAAADGAGARYNDSTVRALHVRGR